MAIDDSCQWWVGSDPGDIEPYLRAYIESEGGYPISFFRGIRCDCGGDRFRVERASEIVRRECTACNARHVTCRVAQDWDEAVAEEGAQVYSCVECGSDQSNVGVGFASYDEAPELDAVKWFYVGVRCVNCGILGCFGDGKVGRSSAAEVYRRA